jgi:lysozyme
MQCFVADMAHFNPVDFRKLAAASWNGNRCVGIIHKAHQGGAHAPADGQYAKRRPAALAAGLLWAAYAFNTGEKVADQVAAFFAAAQPDDATGMYLDFEDNRQSEMTIAQAAEFLDRVEQRLGRHCRMYSGNRLKEQIVHASAAERDFLAADPLRLWACEYGVEFRNVDAAGHRLPWPAPFLWQFTGDGIGPQPHTLDGLEHGADLSIFNGTRDELAAAWAGTPLHPAAAAPAPQAAPVAEQKPGLVAAIEHGIEKII